DRATRCSDRAPRVRTRARRRRRRREEDDLDVTLEGVAPAVAAAVAAVKADRLWLRHLQIAEIGATGRGGVNRQALTPEDAEARRQVLAWAAARGFTASVDAIGNLFVRRAGSDPAAAPVVSGSHLDTQPTGGNFDGIFGVLAAL